MHAPSYQYAVAVRHAWWHIDIATSRESYWKGRETISLAVVIIGYLQLYYINIMVRVVMKKRVCLPILFCQ